MLTRNGMIKWRFSRNSGQAICTNENRQKFKQMKCILNDQIIDQDKAYVHITDLALLRAYGIFDFFRIVELKPLFFEDHVDRFFTSAERLRLKCPVGKNHLKSMIIELIAANNIKNSGIRMVLTGGESPNGYAIGNPTLFVINEPINPLPENHFSEGIRLISHEYLRDLPEVKTINYLMGIYLTPEIQAKGATDVLYHWNGKISELTRSNFFIVDKNDTILTPGNGILKGINRMHVLSVAGKHFKVEERDIFMDELKIAREAFITGTTKKVMPVVQVDDLKIGDGKPGETTMKLQQLYDDYIDVFIRSN
jgi:branched-chain amino acid aminotransferase